MKSRPCNLLVIMTGGTIAQAADANGKMQITKSVSDLIGASKTTHDVRTVSLDVRTGANLTAATAADVAAIIMAHEKEVDGFVLITGTDSMEELAYLLDLTLQTARPVVLTGAMKPSDVVGYDGIANLEQAMLVAGDPKARNRGVLVVMNDNIHLARYVHKSDSQLIGAFESHPGPVAQIRRGEVVWYYTNERNPFAYRENLLRDLNMAVPIIVYGMDMPFWPGMLDRAIGAVIAGMGTASISERWIEMLSPHWTSRIPIVLTSRAKRGTNYDENCYRGSLEKYEAKGFHLSGFRDLNPLQARLKLCLDLAKKRQ